MALPEKFMTPEDYLKFERAREDRHEYFDGEVVALNGSTYSHSLIVGNTGANLHGQLRYSNFEIFMVAVRVKTPSGLYCYPDVVVASDDASLEDSENDTLLDAVVVIEVLSPSTEGYDHGRKFQHYRTIKSLQEYVLIAQDSVRVERYVRQPNEEWVFSETADINATLELTSIQCQLALADVYEKVAFDDQQA